MERAGIGIIGCGSISGIYLTNLTKQFVHIRVVACADLIRERSQSATAKYGVPRASTVEELLGDPEVEIVVNLTPPRAHVEVSRAALEAGKHVYSEKPLATRRADGAAVLRAARRPPAPGQRRAALPCARRDGRNP